MAKKVKKSKELKKSVGRKESELECFKRIKPSDIQLNLGLYPDQLNKTITSCNSVEMDKAIARILQNPLIQKTLVSLKEKFGIEKVDTFLKSNERKIKSTEVKRLTNEVNEKTKKRKIENNSDSDESEEKSAKVKTKKSKQKPKNHVNEDESEEEDEIKSKSIKNKTADPFFVSNSGESYLASIKNVASDDEDDYNNSGADKEKNRQQKRSFSQHNKKPVLKMKNSKGSSATSMHYKEENKIKYIEPVVEKVQEEKLHPSWIAKQQMRKVIQIKEFTGTKIKFDDD